MAFLILNLFSCFIVRKALVTLDAKQSSRSTLKVFMLSSTRKYIQIERTLSNRHARSTNGDPPTRYLTTNLVFLLLILLEYIRRRRLHKRSKRRRILLQSWRSWTVLSLWFLLAELVTFKCLIGLSTSWSRSLFRSVRRPTTTYMKLNRELGSLLSVIDEFFLLNRLYQLGTLFMSSIITRLSRLFSRLAYLWILIVLKIGSWRFEIS